MAESNWDSFARVNAGERFRAQSAAMGAGATQALVNEARIVPGLRVLDVACGSGEPAISIAAQLHGSGEVVGIDLATTPLEVARQRAGKRQLTNVQFLQADVHQLAFADGCFDRVVSRLGVMFFADLPRALGEIRRVLKPGGRVSVLAWGPMEQPYFQSTIGTVLAALPQVRVPAGAASMFKFGQAGTLTAALQQAGFQQVEEKLEHVPWNWPGNPEELWAYFQDVTVPFKSVLEAIPPEGGEIHRRVLEALRQRFDGRQVVFDAAIVLASGMR